MNSQNNKGGKNIKANNITKTLVNSFPIPLLLSTICSGFTRYWKNENASLKAMNTPKITYNLIYKSEKILEFVASSEISNIPCNIVPKSP